MYDQPHLGSFFPIPVAGSSKNRDYLPLPCNSTQSSEHLPKRFFGVGVINVYGAVERSGNFLHSPFDSSDRSDRLLNIPDFYLLRHENTNRSKDVAHIEFSEERGLNIECPGGHLDLKISSIKMLVNIKSSDLSIRRVSECYECINGGFEKFLRIWVIYVHHTNFSDSFLPLCIGQSCKKTKFGLRVSFHSSMKIKMILREVCKYSNIEIYAINSIIEKSMT